MPGSIRVSVLDAFDLPKVATEGENVAVKVSIGMKEYMTASNQVIDGKTPPWNTDFVFPVLNLRDNLFVVLLDEKGETIAKHEMSTPTIVEQGFLDVDLALDKGGKIKLQISFMLTDEERRRIDMMRAAALKRREETLKKKEEEDVGHTIQASNNVKDRIKDIESSTQAQVDDDVRVRGAFIHSDQHRSSENGTFEHVISKPESGTEVESTVEQSGPEKYENAQNTKNALFSTLTQIFTGAAFVAAGVMMILTISRSKRVQNRRPGMGQRALMRKKI